MNLQSEFSDADTMRIFIAHSSHFDFRKKLYEPLRASALNLEHDIFLPQEKGSEKITKELIESCDVLIAEVSTPSLGAGIEMGWADAARIPIIAFQEEGSVVSLSVDNVVRERITYSGSVDFIEKLEGILSRASQKD